MRKSFLERVFYLAVCAFLILISTGKAYAAERAARLISSRGQVETILPSSSGWQKATPGMELPHGSMVRTGEDGVASLLMADETLIKLNRNTRFLIKEARNNAGWNRVRGVVSSSIAKTKVKLEKGEAWFLNKNKAADLEVETSTVTAAIRGTEFNIKMSPDATVEVAVLEGSVQVGNDHGEVQLGAGEVAVTKPGSAPVKRLLLQTDDSVQWTIVIPSLFSSRDLKLIGQDRALLLEEKNRLAGSQGDLARYGMVLRDLGMLDEAMTAIESALAKDRNNNQALTAMGWVMLDRREAEQARINFSKAAEKTPENIGGLALALDSLDRRAEAEKLVSSAKGTLPGLVKVWFELSSGQVNKAATTLERTVGKGSDQAVAWELSSLISLALDKRDEARASADKAASLLPWSPTPLVISSYLDQSHHDLQAAETSLNKALELERENVTAILALARIKFAQGYIDPADELLDRASDLAPNNGEVHNLRGFIKLASRDGQAGEMFAKASKANPSMAEPHLGNALVLMRDGDDAGALEEMSKAVLLDPRRAIFRSYWAKMLYQMERYQKALDVLDIARNLDSSDPTPELYRALALKDLNRPTEAIEALQRAISLNDNRAVYRSRFLLDQDLAVKNVNLAHLFYGLDAIDWATVIAADSVKTDYSNSAAHLFYSGALLLDPERLLARDTEVLLARLLQPANVNTFNSFNEYTSFLERPNMDGNLELSVANKDTYTQQLELTGVAPGVNMAGQLLIRNDETDGWNETNNQETRQLLGYIKWDMAPDHSLLLSGQVDDFDFGDFHLGNNYYGVSEPRDQREYQKYMYEAGYHFTPGPGHDLLIHYRHADIEDERDEFPWPLPVTVFGEGRQDQSFDQVQGQYAFKVGRQHIVAGVLYYEGESEESFEFIPPLPPILTPYSFNFDKRSSTEFIHGTFIVGRSLSVDAAIYADQMETGKVNLSTSSPVTGTATNWDLTEYSPRLGMALKIWEGSTLRLAGFRYLRPFNIAERLEPVDIAGIPVYRNGPEGEIVEEGDIVFDYQWHNGFTSLGAFYTASQLQEKLAVAAPVTERQSITKGGSFKVNLLPFNGVGMALNYYLKDIMDFELSNKSDRYDHLATLRVSWVSKSGLSTGLVQTHRRIDYQDETITDEEIDITDLWISYRPSSRKGRLMFRANNVFDNNFNWENNQYMSSRQARKPGQEFLLSLALYF